MRKSWRRIGHAILWAWLFMLALAAWPSTATAVGLFAGLVVWETARALRVSRPRAKTLGERRPEALAKGAV